MEMQSMKLKSSLSFSNRLRHTLQYREYVTYSTRELMRAANTSDGAACRLHTHAYHELFAADMLIRT